MTAGPEWGQSESPVALRCVVESFGLRKGAHIDIKPFSFSHRLYFKAVSGSRQNRAAVQEVPAHPQRAWWALRGRGLQAVGTPGAVHRAGLRGHRAGRRAPSVRRAVLCRVAGMSLGPGSTPQALKDVETPGGGALRVAGTCRAGLSMAVRTGGDP